ncbi:hypothetical protein WEB32_20950 [Streptomyces netropsis]|uniref:Uncharacterized protein n=1 Tax=Streptomyces netropsis TaxID=55404 RepID=A0A7W7PEL1_STRNE|nr:hypothetical protein [Streptomyces netropsis]MBB4886263.1 hypothetical protein [Streptomyces netropsis]GGR15264.1 hypothetical protein GCM10010219_20230 [Streptomyces netropsis]
MIKKALPVASLLALAAVAMPVEASASDAPTTTASIKGWGRMDFPAPGNDVQVTVDAHGTYTKDSPFFPTRSSGTFRVYHRIDQGKDKPPFVNWGDFKVDCLTTGGPTATVTGTLVRTVPGGPWQELADRHARMGVSFYVAGKGGGPSRIGLSGMPTAGEAQIAKCMAPAADSAVIKGGYTLKGKGPLNG